MPRSRVLLVDDEPEVLAAVKAFLEASLPVDVVAMGSGAAALAAVRTQPFDLIVSDFRMPFMDGLRFLTQASDLKPEVPRVLMTAFPDMQLAVNALNRASIRHFLTKPIDPDGLVQVIGALLSTQVRSGHRQAAFSRLVRPSDGEAAAWEAS